MKTPGGNRKRLLKRIAIYGDEGMAAGSLGMSRDQLMKMNDPEIRQQVESEKESVRDEGDWRSILFNGKIAPHIGGNSRSSAQIVAAWVALNGVTNERLLVSQEANAGNNEFFVALGQYLSGKQKPLWDEIDEAIARSWNRILCRMDRREGAEWMKKNGFPYLSYEAYRQRLVSLRLTQKERRTL
jgi:hypothetical protein